MRIGVIGAGAFGTALAVVLARDGQEVRLWGRNAQTIAQMQKSRSTPRLPGVVLPDMLQPEVELSAASDVDVLLVATPAQSLAQMMSQIPVSLAGVPVVACCKGINLETGTGPSAIISAAKPEAISAVLTGPSFAADIAQGLPTALTLACEDAEVGSQLQETLSTKTLRLYRTTDIAGAELGGALKNAVAIACGVCIGAGLGDSARAALMTRGFAEMRRFAIHWGAREETLMGLSGLGDLALTCTSDLSRNYRFGVSLGSGQSFDPTVTVEGVATAQAVANIATDAGLDMPICTMVSQLATGQLGLNDVLQGLLSRPLKEE